MAKYVSFVEAENSHGLKTILGEGNDETLAAKEGLAQALHAEGQYAEAESILRSIQQSSSNNSSDGVNKKLGRVYLDMASTQICVKKLRVRNSLKILQSIF